jgi:spore germination cell wall hydrolase CwlJ-like protein
MIGWFAQVKKRLRRSMKRLGTGILAAVIMATGVPVTSYALTTQEKINQAEKEKEALENQQENKENELEGLKEEQTSLKGQLDDYNEKMTEISERLDLLMDRIDDKQKDIDDTRAALEEAKTLEAWQVECMTKRARDNYLQDDMNYLELIFQQGNWALLLNWQDYMDKISEADQNLREEYQANRIFIEATEARLVLELEDLEDLKEDAEQDKTKMSQLISDLSGTISAKQNDIQSTEQKIQEYEEQLKKKEQDVAALKKKLAEEIAQSQAAAKGVWRDISEVTFNEGDRFLLANIIYCEAGSEPYAGQVAVGAVVINRVRSSVFPNTVAGVIYQSKQFSPVGSGRYALSLAENRATQSCYRAADEAMSGITNVGNCVFFRTPIEGLTGLSIGGHIFY